MLSKKTFPTTNDPLSGNEGNSSAKLSQNAKNALAEARARRAGIDEKTALSKNERAGRGGLEPTRYNDWEIKGLTSDF